jgi:uncharacterized protein YdbL (DUF1318 family)
VQDFVYALEEVADMKKVLIAAVIAGFILVMGCVRIPSKFEAHITIDIRQHIEQQAAGTLDFIEGKSNALPGQEPPPKKTSWLDVLAPMPVAYAADLNMTSPEIARIAEQLRNRNDQIQALKSKGRVGENNRGYVDLRDTGKTGDPKERNEVQRVVAAENKDRKDLYQEVARNNKDKNVSVAEVERVYAAQRLKRAKPGEIVQLPLKGADFDEFKATPQGQGLGTECVPNAWVTLK